MEPEEIAEAWKSQEQESLFQLNHVKMQQLIAAKKRQALHITNISEAMLIIVNFLSGLMAFSFNTQKGAAGIMILSLALWMLLCSLLLLLARLRRLYLVKRFNLSARGELEQALTVAGYQVRLSGLMQWNTLIIALLIVPAIWFSGKPLWIAGVVVLCFAAAGWGSRWEHAFYKRKLRELKELRKQFDDAVQ